MRKLKMENSPFNPSPEITRQYQMDTSALDKLINDIGIMHARSKSLEVENELLREQNDALIKQNLMMKRVMEEKGII